MKTRSWIIGLGLGLLALSTAAAPGGFSKPRKNPLKERAGMVKTFQDGALRLAVAEGMKTGEMIFVTDPLTQFKCDKEQLTSFRPVVVLYTESGGRNVARVIMLQDQPAEKKSGPATQ